MKNTIKTSLLIFSLQNDILYNGVK